MEQAAEIDLSDVVTREALHERIATALGFPEYYGRNWDAFDECSRDPGIAMPQVVRIRGCQLFAARLPREANLMQQCFSDREAEGRFQVDWRE